LTNVFIHLLRTINQELAYCYQSGSEEFMLLKWIALVLCIC